MAKRGEVSVGLVGRAHVRFGNDFAEGRTAAIEVHVSFVRGLRQAVVEGLAGVFLEMEARDADAFCFAAVFNFKPAAGSEGEFVLGNLVALGKIGVEVIFAGEAGMLVDRAIQRQRRAYAHFDGAPVEDRQRARESEADGTRIGVGLIAKTRGTSAEDFGFGQKLGVDLQADDGLVLGEELGGHCGFGGEFRHG